MGTRTWRTPFQKWQNLKYEIPNQALVLNAPPHLRPDLLRLPFEPPALSTKENARILKKIDWHILPLVSILYLLSFLDRANIGNAKIAGMETDLNLVGLRYNTAAAVFFIPYCLAQVPSNIILKLFRPSRWLSAIMVVWGLIMTLMCLVKTYNELLVARFFLGLAEAGLFPGVTYYLTSWYPRAERARRIAMFISAAILAGAFSGLLAYAIERMEGIGGLHGWQWIFCLEGIVTVLAALACPFLMYDAPETASFLTESERRYLIELLKTDSQGLATHYNWQFVLQALKDYKIYLQFGIYIGCVDERTPAGFLTIALASLVIPSYGIALFTPTIITELGFSAANAQLLSVPPFAAGCAWTLLVGFYSDKHQLRGAYVIAGPLIALVGYSLLYTQTSPGPAYFGTVLSAMGVFSAVPVDLAWVSSNAGGDIKRAVAIAMMNGFGNLGGICAAFIFIDPPRFHVGLGTIMGLLSLTILLSLVAMWDCNRLNKQKEMKCHERGITDDLKDEFKDDGDDSPLFRYTL
ncbi:major facilitator superfamily domain-containing protein [Butyriboletus roseoflavus]|nr:major facilitator superfamily domain-containing protein [Butyriboletus roseoflavus]